jgi:hypothetical protein
MADTHKFMGLSKAKISFFNGMVGKAAMGLGFSRHDAMIIVTLLESLFNIQCAVPKKLTQCLRPKSQGICFAKNCNVGKDKMCVRDLERSRKWLNPNITPCSKTTSSMYTATSSVYPPCESIDSNPPLTEPPPCSTVVANQTPDIVTTPYFVPTSSILSYPTASPQFDVTSTTDPYVSCLPSKVPKTTDITL